VRSSAGLKKFDFSWRETIAQIAYHTGALNLFEWISQRYELHPRARKLLPALRRASQPKYMILCYHRVGTEGIPYYCTLPTSQFEMQMRFLREHFRVLPLSQLCDELKNPGASRNGVAVTFDDGYSDLYTHALPVLAKYDIPATVYLTADCIETGEVAWYDRIFLALQVAPGDAIEFPIQGGLRLELGSPQQRIEAGAKIVSILRRTPASERMRFCAAMERQVNLPGDKLAGRMLSWKQVREMRSAGIFFGSHTLSHPVLSQLDAEVVEKELCESRSLLENRLGEPVLDFAFPFGKPEDCGPIAEAAAARCGYRSAVTTTWGVNAPGANMHTLKRVELGKERTSAQFGLQIHQAFFMADDPSPAPAPSLSRNLNCGHADDGKLVNR
jgi:peptidoglycan/xylan/chitin deacetylase (PgdA/CDA1 family)